MIARTLRDVIDHVGQLKHYEAVAIALELIASIGADVEPLPPLGPPSVDNVRLGIDGSIACGACVATPAVSEIAMLLEDLLPRGGAVRVPGALRYTIARALLEVDAPPFESIPALSAALARHEQGDRIGVLRDLYARASPVPGGAVSRRVERRRGGPAATELRRQLREADEALWRCAAMQADLVDLRLLPSDAPATAASAGPSGRGEAFTRPRWALGSAIAVTLAFATGYGLVQHAQRSQEASSIDLPRLTAARQAAAVWTGLPSTRSPQHSFETTAADTPDGSTVPPDRADAERRSLAPQPPAVVRAPTTVVRAVSNAEESMFSPAFSSDGTALFFHSGKSSAAHSALETAAFGGGDLRVMKIVDDGARNFHVQPSPDGTRVAFDSDRDGERGVYIANRDGTGVRRVSGAGYAALPTWSPDGGRLAFIRAEADRPRVWNLWLLTLDTGETRRLTAFRFGQTWSASWFPDGRRICYTHEDAVIVRDLDSGASVSYASPQPRHLVRTPAVSPDGRHVVFQVARSGAWLLDLTDGSMRCVLTDPTAEEFAWSPDGRRVAFHSRRDGEWGIWLMAPP